MQEIGCFTPQGQTQKKVVTGRMKVGAAMVRKQKEGALLGAAEKIK